MSTFLVLPTFTFTTLDPRSSISCPVLPRRLQTHRMWYSHPKTSYSMKYNNNALHHFQLGDNNEAHHAWYGFHPRSNKLVQEQTKGYPPCTTGMNFHWWNLLFCVLLLWKILPNRSPKTQYMFLYLLCNEKKNQLKRRSLSLCFLTWLGSHHPLLGQYNRFRFLSHLQPLGKYNLSLFLDWQNQTLLLYHDPFLGY